jgi:hypothetical protein
VLVATAEVPKGDEGPSNNLESQTYHRVIVAPPTGGADDDDNDSSSSQQRQCCAICLNEYINGDEICFSQNKQCNHIFHRQCISEWLLTHEECPCCRFPYISLDEDDDPTGESATTDESSSYVVRRRPVHVPAVRRDDGYASDEYDDAALVRGLQILMNLTQRTAPLGTTTTTLLQSTNMDQYDGAAATTDALNDGPIGVDEENAIATDHGTLVGDARTT